MKNNEGVIAVFVKSQSEFNRMEFTPKSRFRMITDICSVRAIGIGNIIGIAKTYDWYRSKEKVESYDYIRALRPDLFLKN